MGQQWQDFSTREQVKYILIRSINKENPQQNFLWFNSATFHSIQQWYGNQLEKSIIKYYFNKKDEFKRIQNIQRYMIQKKSSKNMIRYMSLSLKQYYDEFYRQNNTKIIQLIKNIEQAVRQYMIKQLLSIQQNNQNKKKKKKQKKQKKKYQRKREIQLINQVQSQINNKQELVQMISIGRNTSIQQKLSILNIKNYKQQQYNNLIKQTVSQTKESFSTSISLQKPLQQKNENQIDFTRKKISKSQNNMNEKILNENIDQMFQQMTPQRKSSHDQGRFQNQQNNQDQQQINSSDTLTINDNNNQKCKKKRRKNVKTHKIIQQFKQKVVKSILNRQLTSLIDNLGTISNSSYQSKLIAFQRVRYFIKSMYPTAQAILFGSNAVGLALPSSDIDVMLTGINCKTKEDIRQILAPIAIFINAMGWVLSCSTYLGAKVPLVKLEIDPSIPFCTSKRKSDVPLLGNPNYCLDMSDSSNSVLIKVDITINVDGYFSPSTQLMRIQISKNPSMHRILIALKYSLSIRGYSQNFKGGIGSYCLFVMVAAYYKHFKIIAQENDEECDCEILLKILKFYGEQFQNQLKVITLNQQQCFINNQLAQKLGINDQNLFANPLKIIDPLNGKLMSSSCQQYNSIKNEWRKIRSQIIYIQQLVENEIQSCFQGQTQINKLLTNKKSLQKWINRFLSRVDFSITKIIQGTY